MSEPSKYDGFARIIREETHAQGVILVVFGGAHGTGGAMQLDETLQRELDLPALLRGLADHLDGEAAAPAPPPAPVPADEGHFVKTLVAVDKAQRLVTAGLLCDVCGEIQLPTLGYVHVKAFARLLAEVGAQLHTPEFLYEPAGPPLHGVDPAFEAQIDHQNLIHAVLRMSKARSKKADQS
jgi:hypothetical protein